MTRWVALLRGANVGGIAVRSAELAELFHALGYLSVRTVLASGNVAFEADDGIRTRADLKGRIEQALRDRFGYEAWIVLVTLEELSAAADGFPFDGEDSQRQPWVVFCVDTSTRDRLITAAKSMDATVDPVAAGPDVVYWNPAKGTTVSTPFAKHLAKTEFKALTTNRNLRTLRRIVDS